jgi:hypothetical protein
MRAAEDLDHVRFLLRLVELELIDRERRMVERRIKEARFPAVKSLDGFDFAAIPSTRPSSWNSPVPSTRPPAKTSSRSATAEPARRTSLSGSVSRPARKGYRSGSIGPRPLFMNCWRLAMRSGLLRLLRQVAGYKLLIIDELDMSLSPRPGRAAVRNIQPTL